MTIVRCPACGCLLELGEELLGTTSTCRYCASQIRIPDNPTQVGLVVKRLLCGSLVIVGLVFLVSFYANRQGATDESRPAFQPEPIHIEHAQISEPLPPTSPQYTFTTHHRQAAIQALQANRLPRPKFIELEVDSVISQIEVTDELLSKLNLHPMQVGEQAVLAIRNAIYVMPDSDPEWNYIVKVNGPSPGPDLERVFGAIFLNGTNGTLRWADNGDVIAAIE